MRYFGRIYVIITLLSLAFAGLIWRVVYLGTVKRDFLQHQSAERSLRIVNVSAHRGIIADRNGSPLAVSTPVSSVWASPELYDPTKEQEEKLALLLGVKLKSLRQKFSDGEEHSFVYLKRHLPPEQASSIKELGIPGIFMQQEYQRYYPEGEVTAQLLGFSDIDDKGVEGLELAYDKWLIGSAGKKEVIKDRLGHIVSELRVIQEPQAGHDLTLSIDRNIQYLAYRELQSAVDKYHAESGSAVVLDIKTGEVLAMVNKPSYNPNNRSSVKLTALRNRALTDVLEPGSTMKTFTIANALESGKFHPWNKVDTNPGYWFVDGKKITDREVTDMNYGVLTLTGVLQKSSNVGAAKIALALPPDSLPKLLHRFGFGESTYSGFPGEAQGYVPDTVHNRQFVLATIAFGYGISVTPLQLARAYAILGAEGVLRPITFLKTNEPVAGQKVLSAGVAKQMLTMLQEVLTTGGTGKRGQVSGYHIAGKTGTAYIANAHGYEKNSYYADFVGIAPATAPRLVVVVVIKKPQGEHFAAFVAAPAFANIMDGALRILNVPPDDLGKL
ncbi:MAG: penicillin-binding transpeptidase domain-containing protein [Gammaproteobacteria bacterium]